MELKLDLKDKKILYQLDINSRQSNTKIAKKVGLSKDIVNYRIKKLEDQGLIKGYYSIIDFYKLGYFSIRVYLKLISTSPEKEKEIFEYLIKDKTTLYVNKIDGLFDIGIGTYVKNIYEFEEFYNNFKEQFKKYLGKEQISIFTKVSHFHRAYLLEKKLDNEDSEIAGSKIQIKTDDTDLKILRLLAKNARIELVEISEKLKIPMTTIAFRIKQLEKKKVILAYRFLFDFQKYGYEYYKVDLSLDNISRLKELSAYAHTHPNILYIDQTIGGSDFEFDIEIKNKEDFLKIIDELKEKFPEIREWSYFTVREYKKVLYFPEN
ncbi:MAG: Lrp/AsnC family transcriptional regulator [Nanoarchaeota archaeon]